jgi:hypothetical protein
MTDDPKPNPNGDDGPPPDPAAAELVAYLDGELDPAAARRVEAKLAADPALRARAAALKKTFDLLDYLPTPEPSPTFATRTLDQLPAASGAGAARPSGPSVAVTPVPVSAPTPVVLTSGSGFAAPAAPPAGRAWAWAAGTLLAAGLALGLGYLGAAAARSYLIPGSHRDPSADSIPLADLRVIENLPLYAVADDFEFVTRLAEPDHFGEDPAADAPGERAPAEADKPAGRSLDALVRAFKALPPERQAAVRQLDRQLSEQDPPTRDRLFRALEAYAVWLDRLADGERRAVLAAGTPGLRLEVVREVRERQWVAGLPESQRRQLDGQPPEERARLIARWKEGEADRRRAWAVARRHWEAVKAGKPPYPFDSEPMRKEVIEFVRTAFRTENVAAGDRPRCRLTLGPQGELARLREAQLEAQLHGGWAWYDYGSLVYDLSRKYPMLPEPGTGKPVTAPEDLGRFGTQFFTKGPGRKAVVQHIGKWPDFALEVWAHANRAKGVTIPPSVTLGPARPGEFKEPVNRFVAELGAKVSPAEWAALAELEGKWPEYPRKLVELADRHDLSIPGVTLPGSPARWRATYDPDRRKDPRPAGPRKGAEQEQ